MVELNKLLIGLKPVATRAARVMLCHRALYLGLAVCHGSGCLITGKPELYAPMALLYAVLALRG